LIVICGINTGQQAFTICIGRFPASGGQFDDVGHTTGIGLDEFEKPADPGAAIE
jgi:hypothetical protein